MTLDDDHPVGLVNGQIMDLLEGLGAPEDHEDVIRFLLSTGLPRATVDRVHKAIVCAEVVATRHTALGVLPIDENTIDRLDKRITDLVAGAAALRERIDSLERTLEEEGDTARIQELEHTLRAIAMLATETGDL